MSSLKQLKNPKQLEVGNFLLICRKKEKKMEQKIHFDKNFLNNENTNKYN
jgi:hypothetical protein